MLIFLAALAALAAAPVHVEAGPRDSYTLRRHRARVHAWDFAYHYDPQLKPVIAGKVWTRRGLFWAGLGIGGTVTITGAVWGMTNTRSKVAPGLLVWSGAALLVLTGPIAAIEKHYTLRPQQYWTIEEATELAARGRIEHGMRIVSTPEGWSVVNRAGRPLNAVAVAVRLGDKHQLRLARRKGFSSNLASGVTIGAGYLSLIGGLHLISNPDKPDNTISGIGAIVTGTTLVVGGVLGRATFQRRSPKHFWSREQLEQLLETP